MPSLEGKEDIITLDSKIANIFVFYFTMHVPLSICWQGKLLLKFICYKSLQITQAPLRLT
jgi:hypothetical protein